MSATTSGISKMAAAILASLTGGVGLGVGGVVTYFTEHAKLVDAKIADQKATEISAFLKSSQELYPLVADEVGRLKVSNASGSTERKVLLKNLQAQYSSLQSAAGYLPPEKRESASAYQSDLVRLLKEVKVINDPTQAGPFVDALHDAVIHRCEVTEGLRKSAGLPPALDPACDQTKASASSDTSPSSDLRPYWMG